MAGNRKPRKKFRERKVHVPMMVETRDQLATRLHMGVSEFIREPSQSSALAAARNLATLAAALDFGASDRLLSRVDPPAMAIKEALLAQENVEMRFGETGEWSVTKAEAKMLRAAIVVLDEALARIPVNVWQAAEWVVENHA